MDPGQEVEKGGFPGTVGADDAQDFALLDVEFDLVDSRQAAEEFTQISDFQKLAHYPWLLL